MDSDNLSVSDPSTSNTILELTAEVVSSHLSNNKVEVNDLPTLIREVYSTLASVEMPTNDMAQSEPAVAIKKSVTADYIICLEDGRKMKMLKRHLNTAHNMTPQEYRKRWNLPAEYPMVAPNYAKQRSNLAKKFWLGRKQQ